MGAPWPVTRSEATASRRSRRLLQALEADYPGLACELDSEPGSDDGLDEALVERSRTSLRKIEQFPKLFDYQRDLVDQICSVCLQSPPSNVGLLALPTGSGKTRTAAVALLKLLSTGGASTMLWLAPTRELLAQALAAVESAWMAYGTAVDVELVRADLLKAYPNDLDRGVVFSTPQMLSARLRRRDLPDSEIVVFDEAHHLPAPVFRDALNVLRERRGPPLIGLSATPGRSSETETELLVDFFRGRLLTSRCLGPNPVRTLQQRGILSRLSFREVPVPAVSRLPSAERSLEARALDPGRFRAFIALIRNISGTGRVLAFTPTVRYANLAAAVLRREGVSAKAVSSYSPSPVRRAVLQDFQSGALSVVLNKTLLATGYDCPSVSHVVLGTSIQSPILFEQIVGRGSRGPLVGGNARATVWQFEDHLAIHGLPQSYYRYMDYDWRRVSS